MTPISNSELVKFEAWCLGRYTLRSTRKLTRDVVTMVNHLGVPPEATQARTRLKDYRWTWDVWHDALADGCQLTPLELARPEVPALGRGGRRSREPKRVHEAVSFEHEAFEKLKEAVALDRRPQGIVIAIMARTGLRIGDVLRVDAGKLRLALRDGTGLDILVKGEKPVKIGLEPAIDEWRTIADACLTGARTTIADAVVGFAGTSPEAGGAAYMRCERALKKLGAKLQLDGRLHLHRIRRTVGLELLRAGESIETVSQVLIHDSVKTTERHYTDEYRPVEAAAALGRLNQKGSSR